MIPTETRERFILALTEQMPGADIFEVHFFSARRVGGVESGVAVIAARMPDPAPPVDEPAAEAGDANAGDAGADAEESPYAAEPALPERYTVYSASYRHTLKGPERGRWEVSVKAEADAPLVTVDQVVRGVQRRAEDAEEVDRMTGDDIRAIVLAHQPAAG